MYVCIKTIPCFRVDKHCCLLYELTLKQAAATTLLLFGCGAKRRGIFQYFDTQEYLICEHLFSIHPCPCSRSIHALVHLALVSERRSGFTLHSPVSRCRDRADCSLHTVHEPNLFRYNLPPVVDVPNGFNTLLEGYGKDGALKNSLGSSNRDPILVTW